MNCIKKLNLTSCVEVKKMVIENPPLDNLNKLQELFAKLSTKIFEVQENFHKSIDYYEELYNSKPTLCKNQQFVNGLASVVQFSELRLPRLRQQMVGMYELFPPIYDYTNDIQVVSNRIMENLKSQVVDSMDKMSFVVNPMLQQQIVFLKAQVKENFYLSLYERFSGRAEDITEKLEKQVELFQDIYQFYTFVQSQAMDDFITLNNRFEYETLWRFPTTDRVREIVKSTNGATGGELSVFENFEKLSEEIGEEYRTFMGLTESNSDNATIRLQLGEEMMNDFWLKGGFKFTFNPSDQNCMNCFNARLIKAKLSTDDDSLGKFDFNITHLGVEMQTKIENGYRKYETIKNSPESHSIGSGEVIEGFKEKSPFANFLVELKNGHYLPCKDLPDTEKEQCKYEKRKELRAMTVEFVVSFIPNFPDQLGDCLADN